VTRRIPLHDLAAAAGAAFEEREGWEVPVRYAGVAEEWAAAHEGIGICDRSARSFVRVAGPDAERLLQGLVTSDVAALGPREGQYSLVLTPKGRPVVDLRLARDGEDGFLLECEPQAHDALVAVLRRYRLASRATIDDIRGELAGAALLGRADVPSVPGLVVLPSLFGMDVIGEVERMREVWEAYPGATPVGADAYELLRIESGVPRLGAELDESVLPAEAGVVERAVSFSKGCYVGQEPVARLHYRGHPNRLLRRLALGEGEAPALPAAVVTDERETGRVTSVAALPDGRVVGLAYVRREVEDGAEVLVRDASGVLRPASVEPLAAAASR
jgi:folate-binding protein YgfZ